MDISEDRLVTPLFFGVGRGSRKTLTPGTPRFPCVFHDFTSQSHENHDFYETIATLPGGWDLAHAIRLGIKPFTELRANSEA